MKHTQTQFGSLARSITRGIAALALTATTAVSLNAQPISFLFKGTAKGTFNNNPFQNAAFTVSINADISNLGTYSANADAYENLFGTVDIAGFAQASFVQSLYVFFHRDGRILGFGRDGINDLIDVRNDALAGYNLMSSIGPVTNPGPYHNGQFTDVATTGGLLTFDTLTNYSVQAVVGTQVVPEPATFAFVGLGLAGVAAVARRRRV